jgi:hypothetical protein
MKCSTVCTKIWIDCVNSPNPHPLPSFGARASFVTMPSLSFSRTGHSSRLAIAVIVVLARTVNIIHSRNGSCQRYQHGAYCPYCISTASLMQSQHACVEVDIYRLIVHHRLSTYTAHCALLLLYTGRIGQSHQFSQSLSL